MTDEPFNLAGATRALFDKHVRELHTVLIRDIAKRTPLTLYWLESYSIEKFKDPGVSKVQTLYDFLKELDDSLETT